MTVEIDPFRAISVSRLAHELKAQGRSIIHMEFGQPSTGAPTAAIAQAHQNLDSEPGGYWESPSLRDRIAKLYDDRYGVTVDPERVVMTAVAGLEAHHQGQHAGLVAMDEAEELEANIDVYRANRALMLDALPAMGLRSIAPPDGAFYIYADIGHLTDDSIGFCEALLRETGVATAPGVDFDPVNGHRFIRFSFAVSTAQVEDALNRVKPFFAARTAAAEERLGA